MTDRSANERFDLDGAASAQPAADEVLVLIPEIERVGELTADEGVSLSSIGTTAEEPERSVAALSAEGLPFSYPAPLPVVVRTPNALDAFLFLVLLLVGTVVTMSAVWVAVHFHWFGLRNLADAATNTPLTLATEVSLYLVALAAAIPFFRLIWNKGFFAGIHWHAATAYRRRYWLVGAAVFGNLLAIVGGEMLKFPDHAPVDKLFGSATDAWLIFAFGVTVAPFFEELGFRGFLLPAIATAWDWCVEKMTHTQPRPLDAEGNPVWSIGAMIFGALVVSAPFALIHAEQVGKAWGPLVLLYCVSLILCAVRLTTRSLAASTLVHSTYNFLLFSMMLMQTDGFRHLDKM